VPTPASRNPSSRLTSEFAHPASTVGLGEAGPRRLTPFVEVPDIGQRWSFVAAYGGQEVYREQLLRAELVADGWVVRIPASATAALERAGFR
jgi:hypothetical protein